MHRLSGSMLAVVLAEALHLLIPVGSSLQPNPTWASQLSISPQMAQAKGSSTDRRRQRQREGEKERNSNDKNIILVQYDKTGWSACAFCLVVASGFTKKDII